MTNKIDAATGKTTVLQGLIQSSSRSARPGLLRGALIASTLILGIGAAALGMVKPSDENLSLPEQTLVQQVLPSPLIAEVTADFHAPAAVPFIHETRVRAGDSLANILKRLDIADNELLTFLTRDPKARAMYRLQPGRTIQAATSENGQLVWLRYFNKPGNDLDGKVGTSSLKIRATDTGFASEEVEQLIETHTEVAIGTIERSLYSATDAAGIPDAITSQMAEILSSKVDFIRGLRRGDQFRVIYESRSSEGRHVGTGRVLALEFFTQGKKIDAVWYSSDGVTGSYYTLDGEGLRGAFLRNSLKISRISSTFGYRTISGHEGWSGHHQGVDYAAPTGTPIHATADGTIDFAGWKDGYGYLVIIKHHSKISTWYAHQSRFADGITAGTKVSQGQMIGYVGSTGRSTGPHLHYEFRVGDKSIDPLSATAMPASMPLNQSQRDQFALAVAPLKQQLQVLAKFQEAAPEINNIASR